MWCYLGCDAYLFFTEALSLSLPMWVESAQCLKIGKIVQLQMVCMSGGGKTQGFFKRKFLQSTASLFGAGHFVWILKKNLLIIFISNT